MKILRGLWRETFSCERYRTLLVFGFVLSACGPGFFPYEDDSRRVEALVAGVTPDRVVISTDGSNWMWTDRFLPSIAVGIASVEYGNGRLLAVETDGTVHVSRDGEEWQTSGVIAPGQFFKQIRFLGNAFYLCLGNTFDASLWRSEDGRNWSSVYSVTDGMYNVEDFWITPRHHVLALSDSGSGQIFFDPTRSFNLTTSVPVGTIGRLAYNGTFFLYLSGNNLFRIEEFSNGLGAPMGYALSGDFLEDIFYWGKYGHFFAVGDMGRIIRVSNSDITMISSNLSIGGDILNGVAALDGADLALVVGTNNFLSRSLDQGETWNTVASPFSGGETWVSLKNVRIPRRFLPSNPAQ